jgi:hypothetical protein|tara:strand:- start:139 stop:792 length:654 start_codon:yes stop_codon:yes gene_type:complete
MLIGVVGLIGSGKGTVSDRLEQKHNFRKDSFAKSLKDAVSSMFNWDREMLEGKTDESRAWREKPDVFWSKRFGKDVTPRWVLQYFGTEVMRQGMHDSIWIDSCMARYDGKPTVIADTRFENEIKIIREMGGSILLVKRGQDPDWFTDYVEGNVVPKNVHLSEYAWAKSEYDHLITNDGTLEDLHSKIDDLIVSDKITHTPTESTGTTQPLAIGANSF